MNQLYNLILQKAREEYTRSLARGIEILADEEGLENSEDVLDILHLIFDVGNYLKFQEAYNTGVYESLFKALGLKTIGGKLYPEDRDKIAVKGMNNAKLWEMGRCLAYGEYIAYYKYPFDDFTKYAAHKQDEFFKVLYYAIDDGDKVHDWR